MIKRSYIFILLLVLITLWLFSIELNMANQAFSDMEKDFNVVNQELEKANKIISDLKSDDYEFMYVGEYKISYYCNERRSHICGGSGITASGKPTEVGMTVAADWSVLPKGTKVYIENIGWREVQDKGGAVNGNHIDVLVHTHEEALKLGKDKEGVWVLVKK